MKKNIKKCICVMFSMLMVMLAPVQNGMAAGTHFGEPFNYHNPEAWEKADGWLHAYLV